MAENRLKMRICRIFRSCKSKDYITDDVLETHHHHLMEENPIFSPITITSYYDHPHGRKCPPASPVIINPDGRKCPPASPVTINQDGRKCPPASPIISPLNPKSMLLNKLSKPSRLSTNYSTKYHRGFDAFEEEYKVEQNRGGRQRRNLSSSDSGGARRKKAAEDHEIMMMSLAVVKRSNDPYADFRVSMLEMIVQNQIFEGRDLRNLLRCFLALNSRHYHNLILQVFDEISKALLRDF